MILLRKVVSLKNISKPLALHFANIYRLKVSTSNYPHSHGNILKSDGFYRFLLLRNVDQFNFIFFKVYFFTHPCYLKQAFFRLKNMSFYNFFFVASRIGSDTPQKLPNESPSQTLFQLARDLFISMDSAIICIHLRKTQPPISLKINAASLIRNTLAIILINLLKQGLTFSSNTL